MSRPGDIGALERRIGHRFRDWRLLARAVTHSSRPAGEGGDNQRLEFLGDRVLALVIAERVMRDDPAAPPGELAVRLNSLVSRPSCARVADAINLGAAVRVGKSAKRSRDRAGSAIAGDAIEAVVGAVFLDGGLDAARQAIERLWDGVISENPVADQDPKSRLQIWAQARGQPPPVYQLLRRTGPDHEPHFEVEVRLESGGAATAEGSSKQRAELQAACELLRRIETEDG